MKRYGNKQIFKFAGAIAVCAVLIFAGYSFVKATSQTTVSDTFTSTVKIASTSNVVVDTVNGQVYLTVIPWACGDALVDSRDSKSYTTVLIGSQCWMQQNLNVGTMVTGATTQGTSCASIQKYCYSNTESNCTTYGGLYQWGQMMCGATALGSAGICPTGWHVPTHDEFTTLERAVCTSGTCATDFPYDTTTTGGRGTNEGTTLKNMSGSFKGVLAGNRKTDGTFAFVGANGYFWTSLPSGASAWHRTLLSGNTAVTRVTNDYTYGFSVRCLKD